MEAEVGRVKRRVVPWRVEVADGGGEVGAATTAAPASLETEDWRDDVLGDEAGVSDD